MDVEKNNKARAEASKKWGCRHKFIFKAFLMCVLCYALRFNLSIAIVAMVDDSAPTSSETVEFGEICPNLINHTPVPVALQFVNASDTQTNYSLASTSTTLPFVNNTLSHGASDMPAKRLQFRWNEKDQGLVLGSFFWGYMLSQFPAGLLAFKLGGKWLAALGMLATALFGMALPTAAVIGGITWVIVCRLLQGVASGFVVPSIVVLLSKWAPPEERARLSALCFAGLPLGTALTMISSAYLIPEFDWPSVFYAPGILTIAWFVLWITTVHSTPEDDPHISKEELSYLQDSLRSRSEEEVGIRELPWKQMAFSMPVWAAFLSQFCSAWGHNMLKSEGPKYLHSALHFDIHANSFLSATPYICQFLFMMFIGRVSDFFIEKRITSILTARRLCNTIGQWGSALFFIGLILSGCNRTTAVICYILSGMVNGAMVCGAYVNILDISPRYAGTLEGFLNGIANIAGFGAPSVAGFILFQEPSLLGWNYVFLVPIVLNILGNIIFLFGASVDVQPWNDPVKPKNDNGIEMVKQEK